jgi:hypothetical protein
MPPDIGPGTRSPNAFDVPRGNNLAIYRSPFMSSPKTNEWNLLKEDFDALVGNEGVRQDNFGPLPDDRIPRRFGELIAWAAGHQAKNYNGPWPPGPYRTNR